MLSRTARRLRPALSRARRAHTQSHAASTNRAAQLAAAAAGTAAAAVLLYQSSPRLRRTTPTAECKASSSRNVEDDYELGEMLGDGAFSVVRLARHRKTGKQVAVKVIPRELQSEESIRHEVGVLRRVGMHRAIAKLEDYFESPTHHYIVMEYVDGGELFDHLATAGAYSEKDAAALLQQLAGAVALLHAQKLCHADIKPENLLLDARRPAQARRLWALDAGEEGRGAADEGHVGQLAARGLLQVVRRHARRRHVGDRRRRVHHARRLPPLRLRRRRHRHAGARAIPRAIRRAQFARAILTSHHRPAQIQRRIMAGTFDFEDPAWKGVSAAGRELVKGLLRADPERRLTVEELLQHRWLTSEAGSDDQKLAVRGFGAQTARLRAAVFATMLQQQRDNPVDKTQSRLKRRDSALRGGMLEGDLLARAFGAFDLGAKGYITEADLQRVLQRTLGLRNSDSHEMMAGVVGADREGRRVTYGNFVRMMGLTVKQTLADGEYVFKKGDPVRYFYALRSGHVDVVARPVEARGREVVVNTLHAGEYFGENALLEGKKHRSSSLRCVGGPCEVLKLSKADFEAGFGGDGASAAGLKREGSDADGRERRKLLSFVQMVSPKTHVTLRKGEPIFREGDDHAPAFHIVNSGRLAVTKAGAELGEVPAGECFGEMTLMAPPPHERKKKYTLTCTAEQCEIVNIDGADFLRLLEKSRCMVRSMERLRAERERQNRQAEEKPS